MDEPVGHLPIIIMKIAVDYWQLLLIHVLMMDCFMPLPPGLATASEALIPLRPDPCRLLSAIRREGDDAIVMFGIGGARSVQWWANDMTIPNHGKIRCAPKVRIA